MKNNCKVNKTDKSISKIALASGLSALIALTTACAAPTGMQNPQKTKNQSDTAKNTAVQQMTLTEQARHIQQALATGNYAAILDDIHPTRGVTFSMYAYVQPDEDKTFSREQFGQYLEQSHIRFTWGARDGIGTQLVTPLPDYLDDWVKAQDFNEATSKMTVNGFLGRGNSINNLTDVYQGADFVEFYNQGTEEYSGIDWRALRLVFDEYQGRRYLVAIINDQWTV